MSNQNSPVVFQAHGVSFLVDGSDGVKGLVFRETSANNFVKIVL